MRMQEGCRGTAANAASRRNHGETEVARLEWHPTLHSDSGQPGSRCQRPARCHSTGATTGVAGLIVNPKVGCALNHEPPRKAMRQPGSNCEIVSSHGSPPACQNSRRVHSTPLGQCWWARTWMHLLRDCGRPATTSTVTSVGSSPWRMLRKQSDRWTKGCTKETSPRRTPIDRPTSATSNGAASQHGCAGALGTEAACAACTSAMTKGTVGETPVPPTTA